MVLLMVVVLRGWLEAAHGPLSVIHLTVKGVMSMLQKTNGMVKW